MFFGAIAGLGMVTPAWAGMTAVVLDSQTRTIDAKAIAAQVYDPSSDGPPPLTNIDEKDDAATGFRPFNGSVTAKAQVRATGVVINANETAAQTSTVSPTSFSVAGSASGSGQAGSDVSFQSTYTIDFHVLGPFTFDVSATCISQDPDNANIAVDLSLVRMDDETTVFRDRPPFLGIDHPTFAFSHSLQLAPGHYEFNYFVGDDTRDMPADNFSAHATLSSSGGGGSGAAVPLPPAFLPGMLTLAIAGLVVVVPGRAGNRPRRAEDAVHATLTESPRA